jgi:hypothetical protein
MRLFSFVMRPGFSFWEKLAFTKHASPPTHTHARARPLGIHVLPPRSTPASMEMEIRTGRTMAMNVGMVRGRRPCRRKHCLSCTPPPTTTTTTTTTREGEGSMMAFKCDMWRKGALVDGRAKLKGPPPSPLLPYPLPPSCCSPSLHCALLPSTPLTLSRLAYPLGAFSKTNLGTNPKVRFFGRNKDRLTSAGDC